MSLTAANSIIQLTIPSVFNQPQQLQGFMADDVADSEDLDAAETQMGVDGILSGGYVNVPFRQSYALMADSDSIDVFDEWFYANKANQETFTANGIIVLPSISKKFTLTKGFLRAYKPIPDMKKLLIGQKFRIEWQNISKAPQ